MVSPMIRRSRTAAILPGVRVRIGGFYSVIGDPGPRFHALLRWRAISIALAVQYNYDIIILLGER